MFIDSFFYGGGFEIMFFIRRVHHNNGEQGSYATSSTSYYVTFQVESGDRIELQVNNSEYGFIVEGDNGKLSFQGSRYLSFERQ